MSASETFVASPAPGTRIAVKKLALRGLLFAGAIAVATAGFEWWQSTRFLESTDDAYVGGDVTVIAPKVAGFVARVAVTDNQIVHRGDLLLQLDDRDYRAALERADAVVAQKKAALANVNSTRDLQQAVIAQASADIASSTAEIERSHDDQLRYQRLDAIGAISTQSRQKAEADYKEALASGAKTRAAETAARRQISVIATEKQEAQADLAQAIAERNIAALNLGYTELRAPVDGAVGNRSARNGAYATVGAELLSLVPAHGLWVDANFKEDQLAYLHPGQKVTIKADVLPGETSHGHVASIAPATGAQFSVLPVENATGNFTKIVQRVPVRILLDGDASQFGRLRPGLSTVVTVDTRGS